MQCEIRELFNSSSEVHVIVQHARHFLIHDILCQLSSCQCLILQKGLPISSMVLLDNELLTDKLTEGV